MSGKGIVFAPSAAADLEGMLAWYDEQGAVDTGKRIARELLAAHGNSRNSLKWEELYRSSIRPRSGS